MKLYNTLSKKIETVQPIKTDEIGLYACGFTVYDYTHIGHLRKYTMDDVLVKTLRSEGFRVKFVQNVTDVGHLTSDEDTGEDKLEKGAKKYGKSVWEVAHEFEDYFWYSMQLMGCDKPDISCRATDHIQSQINLVKTLEEKGHTYIIPEDGVYFDTSTFPEYGLLARLDLDQLKAGARVELIEGKRNPTDFALWKFERPGENRQMVWGSPWSERGFPGWHIECSAMAMEYLGNQFDIHTGGIDHIPVHHTNEIAQSEGATGEQPFVRYWVHHNHLHVDGVKMSKSLNNFFTVDDVVARGFHPRALRLLFLTTHYRDEQNFTWESLAAGQKSYERLLQTVKQLRSETERTVLSQDKLAKLDEYRRRFREALANDLSTAEAVTIMYEVVKSNIPGPDKYDLLIEFDEILGLGFRQTGEFSVKVPQIIREKTGSTIRKISLQQPAWVSALDDSLPESLRSLLADRGKARADKDWEASDALRSSIEKLGWLIRDEGDVQLVQKRKI